MNTCSAKNCYLLTKSLYLKTKTPSSPFQNIPCDFCHEMFYCSDECKQLDWQFSHKFKCNSRKSGPKMNLSDYEVVKTRTSYEELYQKPSEVILGTGALGLVKLVRDTLSNRLFALKTISKKLLFQYHLVENLKRETRIQKKLNHPHIIKLYQYFEDKDYVYLVLEYAQKGSLGDYIRKANSPTSHLQRIISEKEAFLYFIQTCMGLDYLHKNGILHRDLKPENLLLDESGNVKLCDFGWSIDDKVSSRNTICGTLEYMAPEVLESGPDHFYNEEIDIWSLGIILYEFLHGKFPEVGRALSFGKEVSKQAQDLINRLLRLNPDERIDINGIFQSSWVKEYESELELNLEEMREKYGRVEDSLTEKTGETETTTFTTDTFFGGGLQTNKCKSSHKPMKSMALNKKQFRNFLETSSDDLAKLESFERSSKSVKSAGIKKLLDNKPKTLIEINMPSNTEKPQSSIFEKMLEMIGCVKKNNNNKE